MFKLILTLAFLIQTIAVADNQPRYKLAVASIFRNEEPYLKEWIEYHRMVGVDHFWLYNDSSQDNWEEVLQPYVEQGLVEIINWPVPSSKHFIQYQCNAYKDALKKATGVTTWLALIDLDEFLLPAEESTVTECLTKHFLHAAAIYINWFHFGTSEVYLSKGENYLSRLTQCAKKYHPTNNTGKSIVRPECIQLDKFWNPHHFVLKPSSYYYNGDAERLSFEGLDLKLDGKVHNTFIRLNHYTMRDESFFHNVKLARAGGIGIDESLVWEHYHAFNQEHDEAIINFIEQKHPYMYEKFWKHQEKSFVTARIYGQLGNNFFQVATACALAWDNDAEPYFPDFTPTSVVYQRVFFRFKNTPPNDPAAFEWNEPTYAYHPITYHPNMNLVGYFQSEKHFAHHRNRLLKLFAPHPDDLTYIQKQYQHILDHPQTVGIQLRYYKWEYPTETLYPQYGKDYLEKAMKEFPESSLFVVSSNNLEFARNAIPESMKNVIFIENEPHYIDFYLLSLCKHTIITNSSFGWWAAWLNQNPNKIIVRPPVWINGLPTQDVCPEEWICIDATYF